MNSHGVRIKKIHICIITTGNIERTVGGEEKFAISISKWLHSRGFTVTILYNKLFDVVRIARNAVQVSSSKVTVGVTPIGAPLFLYHLYLFFFSFLSVLKILSIHKRQRVSIIHAQDTMHSGLAAVIAGNILKIPVIVHSHGHIVASFDSLLRGHKGLRRFYMLCLRTVVVITHRIVIYHASVLIAVSRALKTRLIIDGAKADKIFTIPIGVEVTRFRNAVANRSSVRRKLGFELDDLLISFVGRLSPGKNLVTLIKAFKSIERRDSKAKLLIVGEGITEKMLKNLVDEQDLSGSVIFTGFRTDIPDLLSAIDIFVLPSYVEGCPTAMLEAMASGKAIVASSISTVREIIIDHENGLLFDPSKTNELEEALLSLAKSSKLRKEMMNKGYLTSTQYSKEILYSKILNVYLDICAYMKIDTFVNNR